MVAGKYWVAEHPYSNRNDNAYTFKMSERLFKKKKKRIRVITIASSNNRPIDLKKKTLWRKENMGPNSPVCNQNLPQLIQDSIQCTLNFYYLKLRFDELKLWIFEIKKLFVQEHTFGFIVLWRLQSIQKHSSRQIQNIEISQKYSCRNCIDKCMLFYYKR